MIDEGGVGPVGPVAGASGGAVYQVDPAALRDAAQGLAGVIGELKTLGFDEEAEIGDGFGNLTLTGVQLGNCSAARDAFASFASHWAWGVRSLVQEGNAFARGLGLAAGLAHDDDAYVKGTFKDLTVDSYGNPDESDPQAEKQSLSASLAQDTAPDESWDKAGYHMATTWKAQAADEVRYNPAFVFADQAAGGHLAQATADWQPQDPNRRMTPLPGATAPSGLAPLDARPPSVENDNAARWHTDGDT